MKKYSIYLAIVILLVLTLLAVFLSRPKKTVSVTPSQVQTSLSAQFSRGTGHSVVLQSSSGTLSGQLNSTDFKGTFKSNKALASGNIISIGNKNYSSASSGSNWQENSVLFAGPINMVTHPSWIQIQNQLANVTKNGKTYLQYEILYENPNQDFSNSMDSATHDKISYFGTILVDSQTIQLKELQLHLGKAVPQDQKLITTIDYSPLSTPPVITAPK